MLRLPILTKSIQLRNLRTLIAQTYCSIPQSHTVTSDKLECQYKKGDVIHGFKVDDVSTIDEMFLKAVRLTHEKTNAQYLHLLRDDSNNVFSINFRTTPTNSSGTPHILEHVVTCGSAKFPCRDPFFKMLHRSLATFMNALTGPDYTLYPFSTQNKKDFRNLQSVYLDFVLKPRLRDLDFWQEGWRLEHTDPNDKSSPIIFKGVVYNEMKGVFNENQYIFMYGLMNNLLPSNTYSVISGGKPEDIPKLTHEELVNFHKMYYHPSNSRFFSYGNFPLEDHLKFVNEEYLASVEKIDVSNTKVPSETRWSAPKRKHFTCKLDPLVSDLEKQSTIAIAHVCNSIDDADTTFDLSILSQLLLKGPNSAFYKSLVDTNMGSGFASCNGYDANTKDALFVVGLQEVREEDFGKIEQIYNKTLEQVVKTGFSEKQIEAVLHSLELDSKHQSSNFGLHLLFHIVPYWNHDADFVKSLRINESIARFRNKLKDNPKYLQELVEKYLINNNHKLIATMSPDKDHEAKLAAEEKKLLESKLSTLSAEELDKIYENGQRLLKDQANKDDGGLLPMLQLEDLKPDVERYTTEQCKVAGVPVQISIQPTNDICYYYSLLSTRHLSDELKLYLPIFNSVLMKMGTKNYDYRQFDERVHLKTGGLSITNHMNQRKDSLSAYEEAIYLNSYCLNHNTEDMMNLWEELFNRVSLTNVERFKTLVKMEAANLLNGIAHSGHILAMSSAASIVSPLSKAKESMGGLEYVNRMKAIAQLPSFAPLLNNIREIAGTLLNKSHMRSAVNVTENGKGGVIKAMESYHSLLDGSVEWPHLITELQPFEPVQRAIHHVLPYNVNYTSKAILTVPYTHPDYPVLLVLAKLISSKYLYQEIREKGCAYGGGAKMTGDGVFSFYSYRDPNSTRTFDIYDGAYEYLSKIDIPEKELTEAKLTVFQQLDAPVAPANRGLTEFLTGISDDDLQNTRMRVKETDKEQLMEVARKYLKEGAATNIGRTLIGPENIDIKLRDTENWEILEQEDEKMSAMN